MKKRAAVLFLLFLSSVLVPVIGFGAQSTADVPATEELKAKARVEIRRVEALLAAAPLEAAALQPTHHP